MGNKKEKDKAGRFSQICTHILEIFQKIIFRPFTYVLVIENLRYKNGK